MPDVFSGEDCDKWRLAPGVNPRTGRKIDIAAKNGVYKKLEKDCGGAVAAVAAPVKAVKAVKANAGFNVLVHKSVVDAARIKTLVESVGGLLHKNRYPNTTHVVVGDDHISKFKGLTVVKEAGASRVFVKTKSKPITKPLKKKTREDLAVEADKRCFNDKDPITMDEVKDMTVEELKSMVYIGDGNGKKHCFTLDSAYSIYENAVTRNMRPKNPFDPARLFTEAEMADIDAKMKKRDPNYKPPKYKPPPPPEDVMVVRQMGSFFNVYVIKQSTGAVVQRVGFVPAIVEPNHTGNVDFTSAVVITNIQALFDQGKISQLNVGEFDTPDYWYVAGTRILDTNKFIRFAQHVADLL